MSIKLDNLFKTVFVFIFILSFSASPLRAQAADNESRFSEAAYCQGVVMMAIKIGNETGMYAQGAKIEGNQESSSQIQHRQLLSIYSNYVSSFSTLDNSRLFAANSFQTQGMIDYKSMVDDGFKTDSHYGKFLDKTSAACGKKCKSSDCLIKCFDSPPVVAALKKQFPAYARAENCLKNTTFP